MLFSFITYVVVISQNGKCDNLPIESETGALDWWVGDWEYFETSQRVLKINRNGNTNGAIFDGATCEMVQITKEHSSISAYVWGNIILKKDRCYGCILIQQRTKNVMEFKESEYRYTGYMMIGP